MSQELPAFNFKARRDKLRSIVGGGWLLLYQGPDQFNENLYYLTGLDAPHAYTLVLISLESDLEYGLTTDMELGAAQSKSDLSDLQACTPDVLLSRLHRILRSHQVSLLHVDYAFSSRSPLPAEVVDYLRQSLPGFSIRPLPKALFEMRQIKDPGELQFIQAGRKILQELFALMPKIIRPGIGEADVAAEIHRYLVGRGFNKFYDVFVASGANSAIPFYRDRKDYFPDQGIVLIDICAAHNYYVCDMTRTLPISGTFSARQAELFQAVADVHQKLLPMALRGTTLTALSTKAQKMLADHGLASYYLGKIGHFLGLAPDDPGGPHTPLEKGMVITIEPGLYLPKEGLGLRLEDMVIIE